MVFFSCPFLKVLKIGKSRACFLMAEVFIFLLDKLQSH